jgi:competence protein ComEC
VPQSAAGFAMPLRSVAPRDLLAAFGRAAEAERERWALWLPVALGTGIGIYFALPFEPAAAIGIGVGLAGVLVGAASAGSHELPLRACLGLLAALLIGFGVAKLRTEAVAAPVLQHRVGPVHIEGRVVFAQAHGKGYRAVIALDSVGQHPAQAVAQQARISFRSGGEILAPGLHIRSLAVLMPPPGPAAPEGYDFGRAAYFEGIGAVGYAYGRPQKIANSGSPGLSERISTFVQSLRFRMSARIHAVLPGSTGAIAAALITGDRGGISDEDEQALRDAGLAHVLAIAGLHMALVGLGLFWAVRAVLALVPALALTQPIKKWAAVAALCGVTVYLVISGAAAPAIRAYTMLAMMLIAVLADRPALSMRSLALAAAIILLLRPESLIEPGFQMSFAAVAGLIAVAEWERERNDEPAREQRWPHLRNVRRYMRGIAITSFVGSVATMPYAAYHFDRATHYAVLGNLLAMPIMGFVTMPAAAVSVVLMPFGLDRIPLQVMGAGIDVMLAVGRWVSTLPGAVSTVPAWPLLALVMISAGGLWLFIWRRPWRWFGMAPLLAGIAVAVTASPPDVLISRDSSTVAVRGTDGVLRLMRKASDKYSAAEWLKRDGDERVFTDAIGSPRDGVRCDALGCVAQARGGVIVAAAARPEALAEDCAAAEIVVSAVPTRHLCSGPRLVVDRFDVARNGAYAIWLDGELTVETIEGERGLRPWSAQPRPPGHRLNSGG